jgi:hypothetical protein
MRPFFQEESINVSGWVSANSVSGYFYTSIRKLDLSITWELIILGWGMLRRYYSAGKLPFSSTTSNEMPMTYKVDIIRWGEMVYSFRALRSQPPSGCRRTFFSVEVVKKAHIISES